MSDVQQDELPQDLEDEITSLNSIYSAETLVRASTANGNRIGLTLTLPQTPLSLLLLFPRNYPETYPEIDRVTHVHEDLPKGFGNHVLDLARDVLEELTSDTSRAGEVILFELVEALEARIAEQFSSLPIVQEEAPIEDTTLQSSIWNFSFVPEWIASDPIQSHKSTFLARACPVSSVEEATAAIQHLLATDKRVAKATHNMWAYRIRGSSAASDGKAQAEIVYADADDDGEDGAGMKLAALLQSMGAWGVLVVVSRWYGGIKLGPERWRLIGSAGREAVVRGGKTGAWIVDKA